MTTTSCFCFLAAGKRPTTSYLNEVAQPSQLAFLTCTLNPVRWHPSQARPGARGVQEFMQHARRARLTPHDLFQAVQAELRQISQAADLLRE